MQSDKRNCSVLLMLDLSSALHPDDQQVLLNRLRFWVGGSGSALDWFSSHLSDRWICGAASKSRSPPDPVHVGEPQGSDAGWNSLNQFDWFRYQKPVHRVSVIFIFS